MRKRAYVYNISYFHSNGNGCSQLIRTNKINSLHEFNKVRSYLEETNNLKSVAIINYQLICKTYIEA
jgi:hypothetical protein